jgi:hypothetical protein
MSSYNNQNDYNSATTEVCCEYEGLKEMNKLSFSSSGPFRFSSGGAIGGRLRSTPVRSDTNKNISLDGNDQYGYKGVLSAQSVPQEKAMQDASDYVTPFGN